MSPGLVALAIVLVAAGVIAVAARDARSAIVAVTIVGVASPVLAEALPQPLSLAARLLAAILAGYLLWATVRGRSSTAGSSIGWPAEVLVAAGAGVATASATIGAPALVAGPAAAVMAGVALLVVSAAPLLVGRDALRVTVGALLAVQGASLVRAGVAGPAVAVEELAVAGLIATLGGIGAALVVRAREGSGGLELGARRPASPRVVTTRDATLEPAPDVRVRSRSQRSSAPP